MKVTPDEFNITKNSQPSFELPIAKWIDKKNMTKEEKNNKTGWDTMGGYLKTLSYKDAWEEGWKNASDDFKKWVKGLPNFNWNIFTLITGIEQDSFEISLTGQTVKVEVGGKTYTAIIQ